MSTLESIGLPLAESRALVEHGIVLDTALAWIDYPRAVGSEWLVRERNFETAPTLIGSIPAPVLSEILDAIWDKKHYESIVVFRELAMKKRAAWRFYSDERPRFAPTDLQAAAALLMEVSK